MIKQEYYGNLEFDNRERDVVLISQRQGFGAFNIVFVQRENIEKLIKELNKVIKKTNKKRRKNENKTI